MVEVLSVNDYTYNSVVSGNGKLYVPVKPVNVIYTQFDHVSGVAAKPNQQGVSVSKAQILNSIINQLVTMKSEQNLNNFGDIQEDAPDIDALISDFKAQLQVKLQTAQETGYGLAGATPNLGVLFAIDA